MASTDIKPTQLIINKVSRQKYKQLSSDGQLQQNQVYVVKDLQLNAIDLAVVNVGSPTLSGDAANKWYVDNELSSHLSNYYDKSQLSTAAELEERFSKYTVINRVTQEEYNNLSAAGKLKEDELYVITDSKTTDEIISARLSSYYKTSETSSAIELQTEFSNFSKKEDIVFLSNAISTDIDNLSSNYYKKTETSSSTEISSALNGKVKVGLYKEYEYSLSSSDLSVVRISSKDYYDLIATEEQDDNVLYVVSSDNVDAHGDRVINVAEPELSDDAATKNYVDNHSSSKSYVGWYNQPLNEISSLSIINITRDDYYTLADSGSLIPSAQYIISNDTYLNWPSKVSVEFLSSGSQSQDDIVSCINSIISIFNHVNLDGNQLLRLVTIEKLSSETASQDDIVYTINSILSAYKNKLEPYTVIEKEKLENYYTKEQTVNLISSMIYDSIEAALTAQYGDVLNEDF